MTEGWQDWLRDEGGQWNYLHKVFPQMHALGF